MHFENWNTYPQCGIDDKGTLLVLANTEKGTTLFKYGNDAPLGEIDMLSAATIEGNNSLRVIYQRASECNNFHHTLNATGFAECSLDSTWNALVFELPVQIFPTYSFLLRKEKV